MAQEVRVVDGDSIKLDGTTYRLWGIDALESKQPCAMVGLLAEASRLRRLPTCARLNAILESHG